jgi:anti-sigma factor RsiW
MALQCQKMEETFLHAYVDGEFAADESAEVKAHLDGCVACARAAARHQAYKAAMHRANAAAPHALFATVRTSIVDESHKGRWIRAFRDPRAVGLAAAAVGAAAWFLAGGLSHPLFTRGHSLVDDGIAIHARALPLDFASSDVGAAQKWLAGKVDFGVHLPHLGQVKGVRLSSVHSRPAAVVTYTIPAGDGRRVSLLIVDDPEQQLPGAARRIADREVWLSQARGFNVASWRNDEIVYSLISDLDEHDILALVQSAELR